MKMGKLQLALILISFFFQQILAFVYDSKFAENGALSKTVEIYQMHVKSVVRNRYSQTTVTSKVKNAGYTASETTFCVILPESAFISGFIMEVDGRNYTAYVKEKDEAKRMFQAAVSSGTGAAHVAVSVRDSNRITVSVNVEAGSKAVFYLSYEELLQRKNGLYELVVNLYPGEPVQDLSVEVEINESRKITNLTTPPLRSGNEINTNPNGLNPGACKKEIKGTQALVAFSPSVERQKKFANDLNTAEGQGFAGQFVVQYDVERDPKGGQVLVKDGYFVHFFAPSSLPRLPKHVVFVLDTSESMYHHKKLQQLKEAMYEILDQLNSDDIFHLIEFDHDVKLWVLKDSPYSIKYSADNTQKIMSVGFAYLINSCVEVVHELRHYRDMVLEMMEYPTHNYWPVPDFHFHNTCIANSENIKRAKAAISKFSAYGGTDIYSALRIGLYLVQVTNLLNEETISHQPMLIFLTDGEPNGKVNSVETIVKEITKFNTRSGKTPIFALSFGNGTYRDFLQRLSLRNAGFSKHIYVATDAALQLKNFYREISSPLLANVAFRYESSATNLTETQFPLHFKGSELVTAGCYDSHYMEQPVVEVWNGEEDLTFQPTIQQSFSSVERLWAYLTVKQLLEKKHLTDVQEQENKRKAIDLSLKYSFVTPVTSLVVVKPDTVNPVDIEFDTGYAGTYNSNTVSKGPRQHRLPNYIQYINTRGDFEDSDSNSDSDFDIEVSTLLEKLLDNNRMLNLPAGKYKLGENKTISDSVSCSNSILNSDGHCRLLHSCVADGLRMRFDDYIDHFCVLRNEYAGICCPDTWFAS